MAVLQARVNSDDAVIAAKAEWQNLVQAASLEHAQTKLFANGLRQVIGLMFSQAVDTLSDFGLVPRKARVALPSDKVVLTVKKAKATRVARNTMSKKKKSLIKGVVPETAPATKTPPA